MIGIFSLDGTGADRLALHAALVRVASPGSTVTDGPLAVGRLSGSALIHARAGDVWCALDGVLYPDRAGSGRDAGGDAAEIARRIEAHGIQAADAVRGRFVAATWNRATHEGALFCDVLAVRELFVLRTPEAVLFCTEFPPLLELAPRRPEPDADALLAWLAHGLCPPSRTFFAGVSRIVPGEALLLSHGTIHPVRYWTPAYAEPDAGGIEEHAATLRSELERAIGKRLVSPFTGVILSGGLDSSTVAAVAAHEATPATKVRAYAAVFPGAPYDESGKIAQVAAAAGISATAVSIEPHGALQLALEYQRDAGSPLTSPGALIDIAATRVAAQDGVEALFDGQTGDELFGHSPFLVSDRLRAGRLRAAAALGYRWPTGRATQREEMLRVLFYLGLRGAVPFGLEKYVRGGAPNPQFAAPGWMRPEAWQRQRTLVDPWDWKRAYDGPLWWRYLADTLVSAPHRELRSSYLDRRAAHEGVAADPPLIDVDLIERTLRTPPHLAYDSRFTRPIVREAMRGLLPDPVRLQTVKADFNPFSIGVMVGADAAGLERLLLNPGAEITRFIRPDWVAAAWGRLRGGTGTGLESAPLWRIAMAELWLRTQSDPSVPDEMLSAANVRSPSFTRMPIGDR